MGRMWIIPADIKAADLLGTCFQDCWDWQDKRDHTDIREHFWTWSQPGHALLGFPPGGCWFYTPNSSSEDPNPFLNTYLISQVIFHLHKVIWFWREGTESTDKMLLTVPSWQITRCEGSLEIPALSRCSQCSQQWGLSHIPKETPVQAAHLALWKGICLVAW